MSNQQLLKMDRARIQVYGRLEPYFNLIYSLILSPEQFPTKGLEDLADELEYSVPGTYSDDARKLFDEISKTQQAYYSQVEEKEKEQRKKSYNSYQSSQGYDAIQQQQIHQYEQIMMAQQMLYYQQFQSQPTGYPAQTQFSVSQPYPNTSYPYPQQVPYPNQHQTAYSTPQVHGVNGQTPYTGYPVQQPQYTPGTAQQQQGGHGKYKEVKSDELKLSKTTSTPPQVERSAKTYAKPVEKFTEVKKPTNPEQSSKDASKADEPTAGKTANKPTAEASAPETSKTVFPKPETDKAALPKAAEAVAPAPIVFTLESLTDFINKCADFSTIKQSLKDKVQQLSSRRVEEAKLPQVQVNRQQTYNKKDTKRPQPNVDITKRSEPLPPVLTSEMSQKYTAPEVVITRSTETEEERIMRIQLREMAKKGNIGENEGKKVMNDLEKDTKEVKFNLNLITQENFLKIRNILIPFVTKNKETCKRVITLMIEKAWIEPKFTVIYAQLCKDLAKVKDFQFNLTEGAAMEGEEDRKEEKKESEKKEGEKKKKESNPFKNLLIKEVQQLFDDTEEEKSLATEKDKEVAEAKIKDRKKKIIGNVEFIGELISQKVLSTKVIFLCGGTLIKHFFDQHNAPTNHVNNILAEIFIEAVIKIIEKVGEKFETSGAAGQVPGVFESIKKATIDKVDSFGDYDYAKLTSDEFMEILRYIDSNILKSQYVRVSALLANLEERRQNGWKLHLATETGPMTLNEVRKDVEEGEDRPVEEKKVAKKGSVATVDFEKGLQDIFAKYDKGSYINEYVSDKPIEYKEEQLRSDLKKLMRVQDTQEAYSTFLRLVGDAKKDHIARRIELFKIMLNSELFKYEDFRKGYEKVLHRLVGIESDFPYLTSAVAKIIGEVLNRKDLGGCIEDFKIKTEDEDDDYFVQDLVDRIYLYCDETVKPQVEKYIENKKPPHHFP